jgi:hypothetical protein
MINMFILKKPKDILYFEKGNTYINHPYLRLNEKDELAFQR